MTQLSKLAARVRPEKKSDTQQLVEGLLAGITGRAPLMQPDVTVSVISMEGFGEARAADVDAAVSGLKSLLATCGVKEAGKAGGISIAQEEAAIYASMISTNPRAWHNTKARYAESTLSPRGGISENQITHVLGHNSLEGATDQRVAALEAYDERNNRDVVGFSVTYNLEASRQNEFGEAFYPTVTIAPDQYGFNVAVRILYSYSEVQRSTSGSLDNWNRKNLIRAIIDASILAADQTKLIPVYRKTTPTALPTDNDQYFATGIATTDLLVDNATLTTAPLAVSKTFNLLGLCQTNAALAQGMEDQTDAIDSSVRLGKVYISLSATISSVLVTEYFAFDVSKFATSDFYGAVVGNTRKLQLNFDSTDVLISAGTLTVAGAASQVLAAMSTTTARLHLQMTGTIIQDKGDTILAPLPVTLAAVNNAAGLAITTASGAGATTATALSTAAIVGFDLIAFRTDSNRRSRGALIDVQHVNYLYTVPLLPPITALRPVTASDANDGSVLADLIAATHVQTSNRAVTALLDAQGFLKAQVTNAVEIANNQPVLFGAASNLVLPAYYEKNLDVSATIDSLKDHERILDLTSLLYNTIRDMAIKLWVDSGYGPASEMMYNGKPAKPVVIIGTDPTIGRYLQLLGDDRLVGDQFDYKVVISFDSRMAGKLVFSFGQTESFNSGVPNPLHFGNMAWRPEMTLMMPMVRSGGQSMELTVQPSYRHVNNLPIMGVLNVTNIPAVLAGKVTLNMHSL